MITKFAQVQLIVFTAKAQKKHLVFALQAVHAYAVKTYSCWKFSKVTA